MLGSEAHTAGVKLRAVVADTLTSSTMSGKPTALLRDAVAALVYLRNPYDDRFDIHRSVGFRDDSAKLIKVAKRVRRPPARDLVDARVAE